MSISFGLMLIILTDAVHSIFNKWPPKPGFDMFNIILPTGWAIPIIRRPWFASSHHLTCNGHSIDPTQFSRNKGWKMCQKRVFPIQSCKYLILPPVPTLRVWEVKDHERECHHSWPLGDSKGKSHSYKWLLGEIQTDTVRDSCDSTPCANHMMGNYSKINWKPSEARACKGLREKIKHTTKNSREVRSMCVLSSSPLQSIYRKHRNHKSFYS